MEILNYVHCHIFFFSNNKILRRKDTTGLWAQYNTQYFDYFHNNARLPILSYKSESTTTPIGETKLERENKKIMQNQQLHTFDRKEDFNTGSWRYRDNAKSLILKVIFKDNCVFYPKNQWERTMMTRILRK